MVPRTRHLPEVIPLRGTGGSIRLLIGGLDTAFDTLNGNLENRMRNEVLVEPKDIYY